MVMDWTYTGTDPLSRAATRLYEQRSRHKQGVCPCRIGPLVFMSDPVRTPDVLTVARNLPKGAALIYRHFGADDREGIAKQLRAISTKSGLQFLVGQDVALAKLVGADGVHIPERDLVAAKSIREQHPDWIVTGAAHSLDAVLECAAAGLDACIVSPVFASDSISAGDPLGIMKLTEMVKAAPIPIIALGGINVETARQLSGTGVAGLAGVSGFAVFDTHTVSLSTKHVAQMAQLHGLEFTPGWPQSDFAEHLVAQTDDVIGIVSRGKLKGFVIARTSVDQAEILTLLVDQTHKRAGLGRALLQAAENKICKRGADIMFLDVAADNPAAIGLYENAGYARCGLRPGYYRRARGRVAAILYRKHLT